MSRAGAKPGPTRFGVVKPADALRYAQENYPTPPTAGPGGKGRGEMTRYLISFDHGAMDHIPDEDGPAVRDASLAVIQDYKDAGIWVFAEGVYPDDEVSASVVAPDGTVTDGAQNNIAGVTIIDVPSREEALRWAGKLAGACRCPQEVHEFAPNPPVRVT
jgi:hypothetical protein